MENYPDKFFSYWALVWFIIYYFVNKYQERYTGFRIPSPVLAINIAFLENVIELISLITVNLNGWLILKFCIMLFFVKILPLYLLRNDKIEIKDFYILIGVFSVYIVYLHIRGTSLIEVYKEKNKSLAEGKNDTPFYKFIEWISR
jgi:hypothetical protein